DELVGRSRAVGVKHPRIDVVTASGAVIPLPTHHELIVGQRRNIGLELVIGGGLIDEDLAAVSSAISIGKLGVNAPTRAVLIDGIPGHHEAASTEVCRAWIELIVTERGVEQEGVTYLGARVVIALGIDAPSRVVRSRAIIVIF